MPLLRQISVIATLLRALICVMVVLIDAALRHMPRYGCHADFAAAD